MAAFGSVVKFWPYNLSLTLAHYDFGKLGTDGWNPFWNSLKLSAFTAVFGTSIVFTGAYLVEKIRGFTIARSAVHLLAMLPLATPGLVLGLPYIFFFNAPDNPLNFLYATLALLIINTITHFYTVCHLTAVTALKQLDAEFEAVSASLKVPIWRGTMPGGSGRREASPESLCHAQAADGCPHGADQNRRYFHLRVRAFSDRAWRRRGRAVHRG
jgi:iron(III) transport system permease protein